MKTKSNELVEARQMVLQLAKRTGCTGIRWRALEALVAWIGGYRCRVPAALLLRAGVAPELIERLRSTTRGDVALARKSPGSRFRSSSRAGCSSPRCGTASAAATACPAARRSCRF
jgi:hypothetical protein